MRVEVIPYKHEDGLFMAVVDGKETNHLFDTEAKAFIFAGLYASLSPNDASYLSRYIVAMIEGLNNEN